MTREEMDKMDLAEINFYDTDLSNLEELRYRLDRANVKYEVKDSFEWDDDDNFYPNRRLAVNAGPYEFCVDFQSRESEFFEYIKKGDETVFWDNSSQDNMKDGAKFLSDPVGTLTERIHNLKMSRARTKGNITRLERRRKSTWGEENRLGMINHRIKIFTEVLENI